MKKPKRILPAGVTAQNIKPPVKSPNHIFREKVAIIRQSGRLKLMERKI